MPMPKAAVSEAPRPPMAKQSKKRSPEPSSTIRHNTDTRIHISHTCWVKNSIMTVAAYFTRKVGIDFLDFDEVVVVVLPPL